MVGNNWMTELRLKPQNGPQNYMFGVDLGLISRVNYIFSKRTWMRNFTKRFCGRGFLLWHLLIAPRSLKKKWYFIQDNDPKHKSKKSMELVRNLTRNRFYKHPPCSPDFNVMEDVWAYLDRKVRESRVTTIKGLKLKLTELWNSISWDQFRVNVESMPARLQQCLDREGGRTDY